MSVRTAKPQAAEGGSEPGQFVVERTGDTSQDLTVAYTVATGTGHATPGTDYTTLSGTVTISAGSRTATIDVAALADINTTELPETVTITLDETNKPYKADVNANSATVTVLSRKEYLLAYYGAGTGGFGNGWLEEIAKAAVAANGYEPAILYGENNEKGLLTDFFGKIDADGDKRISKAETEATEVRGIGYSLGGLQIMNTSRKLTDVGTRLKGYKLEAVFQIEKLIALDPVAGFPMVKVSNGPVKTNVKSFVNYYQRKGGNSTIRHVDPNTGQLTTAFTTLGAWPTRYKGSIMDSDTATTLFRVDTDGANEKAEHEVFFPNDGTLGRLFGNDVNHDTMPWWVYQRAVTELS